MCEAVFGTQRRTFATEWFNVLSLSCKEHRAKVGGPKESEYLRRYADKRLLPCFARSEFSCKLQP